MNAQRDAHRATAAAFGHVELRVLGPLDALVEGEPAALGPPKQRALLAHLLLRANEAVPVERLVDALWPDDPPETARHAIQVYVSRLRKVLGDPGRIEARSRSYVLRADADETDLGRFRALVAAGRSALEAGEAAGAAERLDEALALQRGRPLADLDGEPGVRELILELEEERMSALELHLAARLDAGEGAELVPELEQLVAEHPARDQLHADLMLVLYRSGRKEDAAEAYRRAEEALLNELGLAPSARLVALAAAIRREDPALTVEPAELRERRHLPAQPNELVGRERELDELVELVAGRRLRLLTLTGAGGIGKTRLALAAAERLAAHFPDGVWFVDLSGLSAPDDVPLAVAQALGVVAAPDGTVPEALEAHLAEQALLLLVVDNFEHVADAAVLLPQLLDAAPGLSVVATSRASLHLPGEEEYVVSPLALPGADAADIASIERFESVRLFVARARAVSRRFELTAGNAGDVARICVALDGLPLAIELASAAARRFTPAELRGELARSLDVLGAGPIDAPARQQTVRATIEWSYGLLDSAEQQLLARLSVFAGGWTAEAAREICGADEDALASLRRQVLIQAGGERFSMLVTVRDFAAEQLPPAVAHELARAHASYFAGLAQEYEARAAASGRGDQQVLDAVAADYENFRAALRVSRESGEGELLARLADGLHAYWSVRGPFGEGRDWLEAALAAPVEDELLRARVAYSLASLCMKTVDYSRQRELLESALPVFRKLAVRDLEMSCLGDLGIAHIWLAQYDEARAYLRQSHALAGELDDELRLARLANVLGTLALMERKLEEAEPWYEESLDRCRRIGDREGASFAEANLGFVAVETGRVEDAATHYRASLRLAVELEFDQQAGAAILGLAIVAVRSGDLEDGALLLGVSDAIRDDLGIELSPADKNVYEQVRATIDKELSEEAARESYDAGRALPRDEALAYAAAD